MLSEKSILQFICNTGKDKIINTSKMVSKDIALLTSFVKEDILAFNRNHQYIISNNFNYYEGKVVRVKPNFMFVEVEELGEDIYVKEELANQAMIDDLVKIWIFPNRSQGFIEKITKHGNDTIVGKISYQGKPHVIPNNPNIHRNVYLLPNSIIGQPNDLVTVNVTNFNEPMQGVVANILGNLNTPGVDILAKVIEHHVNYIFPNNVLESCEEIPTSIETVDLTGRLDLREELIVTIDGEDAKDFDDAINVTIIEEGYRLGVHIADVSHYVTENSPLDKGAYLRGTSIYLADRVIPMLPFKLSNGICSLNPNEDRYTMSCIMDIDFEGNIISYQVKPSVIRSKHRLTYSEVNKLFNNEIKLDKELSLMLFNAKILANKIRINRENKGSIDLAIHEAKLIVNEEGLVTKIEKRVSLAAEKLIEDFMIVANECVASYIFYMELPFIYRIHDRPSNEKLAKLTPLLNMLGFNLNVKNGVHPNQLQTIVNKVKGSPIQDVVSQLILRSLAKAKYSLENIGHFGLGSDCYTHFTSPIRRYPDLIVHRLLKLYSLDMTDLNYNKLNRQIEDIAFSTSASERKAIELERDVESMKMAEYMSYHIGEEYEGVVTSMIDSGIFIALENMVEGMVRFESIELDYFTFDARKMISVGRLSKMVIKLGQIFKVIVVSASKDSGKIEFKLVDPVFTKPIEKNNNKTKTRKNYRNH